MVVIALCMPVAMLLLLLGMDAFDTLLFRSAGEPSDENAADRSAHRATAHSVEPPTRS